MMLQAGGGCAKALLYSGGGAAQGSVLSAGAAAAAAFSAASSRGTSAAVVVPALLWVLLTPVLHLHSSIMAPGQPPNFLDAGVAATRWESLLSLIRSEANNRSVREQQQQQRSDGSAPSNTTIFGRMQGGSGTAAVSGTGDGSESRGGLSTAISSPPRRPWQHQFPRGGDGTSAAGDLFVLLVSLVQLEVRRTRRHYYLPSPACHQQ